MGLPIVEKILADKIKNLTAVIQIINSNISDYQSALSAAEQELSNYNEQYNALQSELSALSDVSGPLLIDINASAIQSQLIEKIVYLSSALSSSQEDLQVKNAELDSLSISLLSARNTSVE